MYVDVILIEVSFKLEFFFIDKFGYIGYDYSESNYLRWVALEEVLVSFVNNGIIFVIYRLII